MNNISTISKNYAKALFDSGLDSDSVRNELSEILDTIELSDDLKIVFLLLSCKSSRYKFLTSFMICKFFPIL